MQPEGRTFLIAGGSSGLGAACARRLSDRGASVVIADIDEGQGEALAAELGDRAAFAPADLLPQRPTADPSDIDDPVLREYNAYLAELAHHDGELADDDDRQDRTTA